MSFLYAGKNYSLVNLTYVQISRDRRGHGIAHGHPDLGRLEEMKVRFPAAKAFQIALSGQADFVTPEGIRAMPAVDFLRTLI